MADQEPAETDRQVVERRHLRTVGAVAGVSVFLGLLAVPAPPGFGGQAWAVAAVAVLMAIFWMTEAVPLAATALLPLILFPLLGVADMGETAVSYAHPLVFLFLGGFMLARGMERWGLHRRIAFGIVRAGGRSPALLVLSVMVATAFLSMWVSNTATAMMMLPIGVSIAATVSRGCGAPSEGVSTALMLGIAYAATIGGMGTLIGTPPNALFASFMMETYGIAIGFVNWMAVGLPVVLVLLPATWLILTGLVFRSAFYGFNTAGAFAVPTILVEDPASLGPLSRGEVLMACVMGATAFAWISRPLIAAAFPGLPITDPGIAVMAAFLLFLVPVDLGKNRFLLSWEEAAGIRWDVLILFGGGLALAAAMAGSGLVAAIADAVSGFGAIPLSVLIVLLMVVVVYLGELASNTAMAAMFLPISGAIAVGMGLDPLTLALPVTLAASLGFMLPVATPPNAIVYGSGAVTAGQMLKAGALLDVVSIALVAALCLLMGSVLL